ncbi:prepilin peptidase [Pilimelia terevasa]|uniref:Prepilin leader peptidase/N-methyltransferase n=1 Tax=Pilimelia terevasa TaxID=53372 RepID=A0A8J3BKZ6_9ACTN|nr:A24 family peptidase [Pilimelia terevasa]GGK28580.1 prepilin peptidase [Pilimelia terevasa]
MTWVLYLGIGALGLAVGSFLNVVIHRVPRGESVVRPGSRCPRCAHAIAARHNVPVVSWLLLRGRCAHCREPVSVRYPLVEAGTAALFVAVTARFGVDPALPAYLYLAAVAVALAMIDVDVKRLPNVIVLPSYGVGVLLLLPAVLVGGDWSALVRGLLGMTVLFALYFTLTLVHPAGMGFGDVKLAGLLGLYLGWLSWSSVWVGTLAGFLLGSVVGVALLASGRADRKTALPFGPAMLAGAFLAVFVAAPVTHWYASLLTAGA